MSGPIRSALMTAKNVNLNRAPSEAQKAAGNYKKHHVRIHGLDIALENVKGGKRSGIGKDGRRWAVSMPAHYGYIKRTEGADGDHVDVYVGPDHASQHVYVIDQKDAHTGKFDEHKVMLGFNSEDQARATYIKGFSDGKGAQRIQSINPMSIDQFKDWLKHGNTTKRVGRSLGGKLELNRAKEAKKRAPGQVSPSKYMPDVPRQVRADGGDVEDGLDQFFGPTDQNLRRRYYTGTSKDKDFTSFQESRHGTWLTSDPKEASDYAEQNDSQGYRPGPGWTYEKTNTASRVIPAYVRIENPYTGELPDFARVDNYKKAQSDWFDTLRRKGHDAWVPASSEGRLVVKLTNQGTHIKSAIGNSGDYNLSKKHLAKAEGGEVEDPTPDIANPMSIFPKPQRMFPEDARPPGGQYLAMPDKRDVTGHKAAAATIGVQPGGKPFFRASQDAVEQTGSTGRGTAMARANLFKQKAGWKWLNAPEEHGNTDTIVSVEHRGKHHYALNAHFPKGVDLARYENSPSEPRLRPTTTGNVELGPQAGSILVRGKEHPVYRHVIVKEAGGLVAPQYENPAKLAKKALMAAKKTGSRS